LKADYSDTPYAVMAAMLEADFSAERADLETAHSSLDWAYQHAGNDALKALAGIAAGTRRNRADESAGCAGPDRQTPGVGVHGADRRIAWRRTRRSRRKDEARTAYTEALANLDPNSSNRAFVEMKLNDLVGAEKKGS
jgi:predicted negative regulator of RcsB-dependent stress response